MAGVGALCWATLEEPRCVEKRLLHSSGAPHESIVETLLSILRGRTFRWMLCSYVVSSFFDTGRGQWLAAYYMRSFGLSATTVGAVMAISFGGVGLVGVYLGGWIASRFIENNEHLQLRLMAACYLIYGLLSTWMCITTSAVVACVLAGLSALFATMPIPAFFSILQRLVPEHQRAQATAFVLLASNLIGMGLGPLAAGAISDGLKAIYGTESLRYALLALCPGYLLYAWSVFTAARSVSKDLGAVPRGLIKTTQREEATAP